MQGKGGEQLGAATSRACLIRIQSSEEYTDNDQIGDKKNTKSGRQANNWSRLSYVKAVLRGLEQLLLGLSKIWAKMT